MVRVSENYKARAAVWQLCFATGHVISFRREVSLLPDARFTYHLSPISYFEASWYNPSFEIGDS